MLLNKYLSRINSELICFILFCCLNESFRKYFKPTSLIIYHLFGINYFIFVIYSLSGDNNAVIVIRFPKPVQQNLWTCRIFWKKHRTEEHRDVSQVDGNQMNNMNITVGIRLISLWYRVSFTARNADDNITTRFSLSLPRWRSMQCAGRICHSCLSRMEESLNIVQWRTRIDCLQGLWRVDYGRQRHLAWWVVRVLAVSCRCGVAVFAPAGVPESCCQQWARGSDGSGQRQQSAGHIDTILVKGGCSKVMPNGYSCYGNSVRPSRKSKKKHKVPLPPWALLNSAKAKLVPHVWLISR